MATSDDPIPFWRRLAGTLVALLSVLGLLALVIGIIAWVATSRFTALLESNASATQPAGIQPASAFLAKSPVQTQPSQWLARPDTSPAAPVPAGVRPIDGRGFFGGVPMPASGEPIAPPANAVQPSKAAPRAADADRAIADMRGADPDAARPKAEVVTVDSPHGEFTVPMITLGKRLVVKGRVKTLTIAGVTAGAVLDASEIDAQDIKVRGLIDGGSAVKLRASERVKFGGSINGRSSVEVSVVNGRADFATGVSIDGGSRVTVAALDVHFHGIVAGERTDVAVTISQGGSLRFVRLDGSVRMRYGKANAADDKPTVEQGKILGQARFGSFDELQ